MADRPMVRVEDLHRSYGTGAAAVHALRGVSFEVPRGELVALRGRSGSGKTTLLDLVGGRQPGPGHDHRRRHGPVGTRRGRPAGAAARPSRLRLPVLRADPHPHRRREHRGADAAARHRTREREERVGLLLSLVGLADQAAQRPGELSGGRQQRVAVARALANRPALLIADEPTGQLDAETGLAFMELLRAVVRSEGVTALVATHDAQLLGLADRVLALSDGEIAEDRAAVRS
ncbi:ATP-binding cassette domain-containing protein [Streptomyces sp. NPDC096153]|uniref:ABC transporter ATP-binding protein n=1 Tax=Streptomyces sp. NPDC096153 TaxID=3155548 RepID=UPI0033224638